MKKRVAIKKVLEIVTTFRESGLSVPEFCKRNGIKPDAVFHLTTPLVTVYTLSPVLETLGLPTFPGPDRCGQPKKNPAAKRTAGGFFANVSEGLRFASRVKKCDSG